MASAELSRRVLAEDSDEKTLVRSRVRVVMSRHPHARAADGAGATDPWVARRPALERVDAGRAPEPYRHGGDTVRQSAVESYDVQARAASYDACDALPVDESSGRSNCGEEVGRRVALLALYALYALRSLRTLRALRSGGDLARREVA